MWKKQLIAMNLVLLLLALTAAPTMAAGPADGEDLNLQAGSRSSYSITVDGTSFYSDRDARGWGWSYEASSNTLTLDGYTGGGILSQGPLYIDTENDVTINGNSGSDTGADGIAVYGDLSMTVKSGTLRVYGGTGRFQGGDAVFCNAAFTLSWYGSSLNAYFYGGHATSSYSADDPAAGSGISSKEFKSYGSDGCRFYAYGGDVPNAYQSAGGFGLYGDRIEIFSNCTIRAGSGTLGGGAAVDYRSYCEFGAVFADLDGGKNGQAIYTSSGNTWYLSPDATWSKSGSRITITPKQYRITLYGNAPDASHDGQSTVTLTPYYGDFFSLYDYTFQRPGYTQVAWTKDSPSGSAPLPLDYEILAGDGDTSYYAYWVPAEPGDVILNALDGRLPDGSFYQKSSSPVTLPQVDFEDEFQNLLGWCTLAKPESGDDPDHVLPGQWYEVGDTIPASPDRVTQLYARGTAYFGYYVYHPGAGSVANGGTVLVQTIYASSLLDSSYLTPPAGYTFAGWSTQENATEPEYQPGEYPGVVTPPDGIVHLYAVWKSESYTYTPAPGLTVTSIPSTKTIQVAVSDTWAGRADYTAVCALYEGDKMVDCALSSAGSGTLELHYQGDTPPLCKVFALGKDWKPLRVCTSYTPAK